MTTETGARKPLPERIEVKQFIDRPQLTKDVAFSLADLSSAVMEQAALYVHYGILAAEAARQVDQFETRAKITESAVYRTIRDEHIERGEKITEPALAAKVTAHSAVRQIKIAINEAKMIESICKTAVEGFRQRRDMLVQMSALSREELKGELVITQKRIIGEANADQTEALRDRLKAQMAGTSAA